MLVRNLVVAACVVATCVWLLTSGAQQTIRVSAPAAVGRAFDAADHDRNDQLSRTEFAMAAEQVMMAGSVPSHAHAAAQLSQEVPRVELQPPLTSTPQPSTTAAASLPPQQEALPQCSLVFFYHIVKTGGTTMRTVLQRQAQLGEFEYIYTDTTRKPRWQLLMHQLTHPVSSRRIIIELHSEWGLSRTFFADVARLRGLYEPLGCKVTLATVLRHPLNFYLSWYNWRAANYMPLCLWDPPRDPQSRQLTGYGLPFVMPTLDAKLGGRTLHIPPSTALSVLRHFDVVGLTERFDESLLLIGAASGMRNLGYARLADNLKPDHPRLAKAVLRHVLRDAGLPSLNVSCAHIESSHERAPGTFERRGAGGATSGAASVPTAWSSETREAMRALDTASMRYVIDRAVRERRTPKADCNFYPCTPVLTNAKGIVDETMCEKTTPEAILALMLDKTATDRAIHEEAVRRLDAALAALAERARTTSVYTWPEGEPSSSAGSGVASLAPALATLRAHSADVQRRRDEQLGFQRRGLCGVRLCGDPLRSCVGCEPNPVPGLEPCWPSWEDQFTPDERKMWCKRSMTKPGYDKAEIEARTYPQIVEIPCWQTCWEVMAPNASAKHGVTPTCLERDAPRPIAGATNGPSCANRKVHCSPGCTEAYKGHLKDFWKEWEAHESRTNVELGIKCPCGNGG